MIQQGDATASVDRFLDQAARLTQEQWETIYRRYVADPAILQAVRTFQNAANQVWIGKRVNMTLEEKGAEDVRVNESNARIAAICAILPEAELDADRGGHLRQRAAWILTSTRLALANVELLKGSARTRNAVKRFLTLFADVIEFPEFE